MVNPGEIMAKGLSWSGNNLGDCISRTRGFRTELQKQLPPALGDFSGLINPLCVRADHKNSRTASLVKARVDLCYRVLSAGSKLGKIGTTLTIRPPIVTCRSGGFPLLV